MAYNFSNFNEKAKDIAEFLSRDLKAVQTGRATPAILDSVYVEAYGSKMAIAHVASVVIEDAKTLRVSPYDKSVLKSLEQAVNDANLGVSVSADSEGLRVFFPQLTTERRTQYVKIIKDRLEDARIKLRGVREETKRDIEKEEVSEDEKKRNLDDLQKKVDSENINLEAMFKTKEKEVLGE
jgi:ribosome recycling factor